MRYGITGRAWLLGAVLAVVSARGQGSAALSNADGSVRVDYNLATGLADVSFQGAKRIAGAFAEARLGAVRLRSQDYAQRKSQAFPIQDGNGRGQRLEITCTGTGPAMKQIFYLYDDRPYLLTEVEMDGNALAGNWMSPLETETAGGVDIGGGADLRALEVPWDNDRSIRYNAGPLNRSATSYEVSAFYDNASRRGLVTGSVSHDLWKTGIDFTGAGGKLDRLAVYGGANSATTRDVNPHGSVHGNAIRSPRVFAGFFDDWRDGLETFGDANAANEPPLRWQGGRIFAWNSWGEMQFNLSLPKVEAVSDFYKNNLQNNGFRNDSGVAYINLDAGGGQLGDAGLRQFVQHCHANGQKAGTYFTPFFYQGDGAGAINASLIKDANGNLVRSSDQNACSRDPTHPLTRADIRSFITNSIDQGFEYVKMDFVSYGNKEARAGRWYDSTVMTGTQAYAQGMRYLDSVAAGRLHLNLSISAIFPYAQAHSRRISCDAYGSIKHITYELNSASYGWWLGGRDYTFNDPDHLVLARWSEAEARSRFTSGIVTGGIMMLGDDFSNVARQDRAKRMATVAAINALARMGRPFRPVEGNTGTDPSDAFELMLDTSVYVAVFNYANATAVKSVPLARLGIADPALDFDELWTGGKASAQGNLSVTLAAYDVALFKSARRAVSARPGPRRAGVFVISPLRRPHDVLGRLWDGAAPASGIRLIAEGGRLIAK